jgi:hypothetical protein
MVALLAATVSSTQTLVQAQTTVGKEQQAIKMVANQLQVPESNLKVVAQANIDGITQLKVLNVQTGRTESVNLDSSNRQVPLAQVQQTLANKRSQDFQGKVEKELATKMSQAQPTSTTDVVVWAKTTGALPAVQRPSGGSQALAAIPSQAAAVQAFKTFHKNTTAPVKQFLEASGGKVKYQSDNAPLLVVSVPNHLISALEKRTDVQSIQLARTYKPDLNVAPGAIDANKVWSRTTSSGALIRGTGVKVAVVEGDGIYYAHSNLADGSYCNSTASSPIGNHATAVAGTIGSTNATYRGVAFGVPAILSGNTIGYSDAEIIKCTDWAINNGARVINYSFSVDSSSSMVALDRYVDYVVRNRAVTLTKSAGNIGSTCSGANYVTSPGKGWNMITVGSYDDRNTVSNSDDIMSSFSCYEDPSSPRGDRQKPEVAAPGSNITTTCSGSTSCFASISGTSFSTPITAACSALMMQRNTSLQYWPESIRAVLMASAVVNLEGSTRLSEKDGAGGIECDSADDVLRGAAGYESHGSFVKTDFPKTYTFTANAGQTVRVVIAWDSTPDLSTSPTTDVLKADLDLDIYSPSGSFVTSSSSWDNSYEIVEFTAPATGTYSAKVNPYRFDGSSEFLGFAVWKGTREKN